MAPFHGTNLCTLRRYLIKDLCTDTGIKLFNEKLCTLNFQEIYAISNLDSKYDLFIKTFTESHDKCFPLKKVVIKEKKCTKPWLTNELKKRCKKKNILYKKYLLAPSSQRESSFKIFRNKLNKDIKNAKKNFCGIRGNPHSWFKSYLMNRKQFVVFDNASSQRKTITTSVPQGSELGPL